MGMTIEQLVKHWEDSADKNYDDMLRIYDAETNDWALYVGHLCIEKLLKAILIKKTKSKEIPLIHNLIRLAKLCGIETTSEMDEKLSEINTFNMEAKYQLEKREFYKRCTKQYTDKQIRIIKEIREWLKEKLMQKS